MSAFSIESLIAKSSAGDDQARTELLNRYRERIKFLVRVRLGPKLRLKLDSSDIVQDVFIKGLDSLRNETGGNGLKQTFLDHLAKNVHQVICDRATFWAAAKRDPARECSYQQGFQSDSHGACDMPDPNSDQRPLDQLQVAEEVELLLAALGKMADQYPAYWELLVATKIEGRSLEGVAKENNLTTAAVKMKTKRAMLKLVEFYRAIEREYS